MTDASTTQTAMAPSGDGVAGNAASYGAQIKAATIKLQDTFLITKYRRDYEAVILNLDDFINNLMLKNALSFDKENPEKSLTKLVQLQEAKLALNSVMKFVDSQ
jgi:DNA primase large subunit